MAHFASANRDDCASRASDSIGPEREDIGAHLAFGKGIHFCIGAPPGRLELRVALPMLLRRLPGLRPLLPSLPLREAVFFARGIHLASGRMGPVSASRSSGRGRGARPVYCRELAAAGYTVVGADVAPVEGVDLAVGRRREDREATERLAGQVLERFGRIDALVNNAAVYSTIVKQPFEEITDEEWDDVLGVNVKGAWLCARAVAPAMRGSGAARSSTSRRDRPDRSAGSPTTSPRRPRSSA